ncbi:MAG: FAD-dependent oxidoreductase, partial [Proteobacteria bacterium]|nr:FAD-dependent oxidoreductase [Pseudomonadota bacterium]
MAFAMRRSGASSESIFAALNRRKFLSSAGAGIIGVSGFELLSGCATPSNAKADSQVAALNSSVRVVIVGAGTAGLTTAYRLMKQGVSSVVFEASSRIGGRMYTQTAFNDEGMFCERGGEFIDSQHLELISLCNELGLVIQDLAQSEQGQTRELFFSQNQVRSEEQVVAAFKPLAAKLASDIRQAFPTGEVQVPTYNSELAKSAAIQALDRQSIAEYLHLAQADNWLNDLISTAYVGEYGLETSQQSALNLVLLIGSDV